MIGAASSSAPTPGSAILEATSPVRRRRIAMWKQLLLVAAPTVLLLSATAPALEPPTFNDEVVRILQTRCQTCHRPGEHAPFSLLTYRDVHERLDDIRDAVKGRVMPPWKPVPGFGDFVEPRRLSDLELTTLVRWIEAGAPEGDPAKLSPPLVFRSEERRVGKEGRSRWSPYH